MFADKHRQIGCPGLRQRVYKSIWYRNTNTNIIGYFKPRSIIAMFLKSTKIHFHLNHPFLQSQVIMIIVLFLHIGKPISAQTNSLLCWPQIQPSISTSEGLAWRFKIIPGGLLLAVSHLSICKTKSWWKKRGFANLVDQTCNLQIKTGDSNKRRWGEFCRGGRGTFEMRGGSSEARVISLKSE